MPQVGRVCVQLALRLDHSSRRDEWEEKVALLVACQGQLEPRLFA